MRPFATSLVVLVLFGRFAFASEDAVDSRDASARNVVREINLARQNPAQYAAFVESLRGSMMGNVMVLPGGTRIRIKEGVGALNEAIRFLRTTPPQAPLVMSSGMSHAAADHCADQAAGGFGHRGRDSSNALNRISRYGTCRGSWGENISYGKSTARAVVLALIIDDGQSARKHRKNIFNPAFNFAGAALGRHAKFGTICSVDFAAAYAERGHSPAESLVAGPDVR